MAYVCKDCSYRGAVSAQGGECPACGSFNLTRPRSQEKEERTPPRWRLVIMILSWGVLAVIVARKLL